MGPDAPGVQILLVFLVDGLDDVFLAVGLLCLLRTLGRDGVLAIGQTFLSLSDSLEQSLFLFVYTLLLYFLGLPTLLLSLYDTVMLLLYDFIDAVLLALF